MAKKTSSSKARKTGDRGPLVTLRVGAEPDGMAGTVTRAAPIEALAADWMYVLRNRPRWSDDEDLRDLMQERARRDLKTLGIDQAALARLAGAKSRQVEVGFHDARKPGDPPSPLDDAASAFPWEFVISSATRGVGRSHPIVITRWLPPTGDTRAPAMTGRTLPREVLFVESAPGRIGAAFSFDSERARLEAAIGARWRTSHTQSAGDLQRHVIDRAPKLVHVTGIDNHQAAHLIEGFYDDDKLRQLFEGLKKGEPIVPPDGMVMRGTVVAEQPVDYRRLASCVVPDGAAPWLVTLNLHYSAARTARECVRRGAHAALGFLDEIDDELAEYFFQAFYREFRDEKNADLSHAFGETWKKMREHGQWLYGTGIVLWRAESAFATESRPIIDEPEAVEAAPRRQLPTEQQRRAARARPMLEVLQVETGVPDEINYSLLHNGRPFLDNLVLSKLVDHPLDEVKVQVDLNAGEQSHPFRHTELLLDEAQRVLTDVVTVPLTAQLLRTSHERVRTTVYVRVEWDGRVACEQTMPVTLLPVDEWFDDTEQNPWLPSFVLPRDPAVQAIITRARPHLVKLMKDKTASFDGYQSDSKAVDKQVQAIWTTLVKDFKLLYINPPPAYSHQTQRLRTPSEILATSSGTCIDLTLLLASCLEYIEVFPVLVLLTGHAFVGYWRSEEFHDAFRAVQHPPKKTGVEVGPVSRLSFIPLVDGYRWRLSQQQYPEIVACMRRDELRMLEATGLCSDFSFADALKAGTEDMEPREDFDSLLDLRLARTASPAVTPLPVITGTP